MTTQLITPTQDTQITATEDTQFVLDFPSFDKDTPYSVTVHFEREGVQAEIIALYALSQDNHLDLTTTASHEVPNTSCQTSIKGVLLENAYSKYIGKIVIEKKAQQTSSFLNDNVLLIGEHTIHRSDPILEIDADDVKASHGATTGGVNKDHLYYLMSRGLDKNEAEALIIQGFFEELLSQIIDEKVRKIVTNKLRVNLT